MSRPPLLVRRALCLAMILATSVGAASGASAPDAGAVTVDALNFVRARTALQFDAVLERSGGVNRWGHVRGPIPLDQQRSTRMNRDTLYSSVLVDISEGATLTLPDSGGRFSRRPCTTSATTSTGSSTRRASTH